VQRVQERVAAGGHDIPEAKIRERYETSRANLIRLLPRLASLRLYDNSAEGDPKAGRQPQPQLLLHMEGGRIVFRISLDRVPQWAKPIMAVALA
jgi:predicted ABC-type ATPase